MLIQTVKCLVEASCGQDAGQYGLCIFSAMLAFLSYENFQITYFHTSEQTLIFAFSLFTLRERERVFLKNTYLIKSCNVLSSFVCSTVKNSTCSRILSVSKENCTGHLRLERQTSSSLALHSQSLLHNFNATISHNWQTTKEVRIVVTEALDRIAPQN